MAKKYAIYGFSYINEPINGMNVLNGTKGADWDEVYEEFNIACFNGIAYFKTNCGCYTMTYPKFNQLTYEDKCLIRNYVGYTPEAGEYGAVCSRFGNLHEISLNEFKAISKQYPIKKSDYHCFAWLNGMID